MSRRYSRLSPIDFMMLRTETASAPTHVGGLCILQAEPQFTDLEQLKASLLPRIAAIPELHRIIRRVPPLCGPPLWIDDPGFSIDRHVFTAAILAPGDEQALLDKTAELLRPRLDRSKPLWEMWVLTGLEAGRIGLLFKIHHALADGMAAVRLIATLLDDRLAAERAQAARTQGAWSPSFGGLLADNIATRLRAIARPFRHPVRNARALLPALAYSLKELRSWNEAPRTSLNRIVGPERSLHVLRIDLDAARSTAHTYGGKVNDIVLAVITGGISKVLRHRGEVIGDDVIAAIAVNLRDSSSPAEAGNVVGALRIRLPIRLADPRRLLGEIAQRSLAAKAGQRVSRQSSNVVLGFVGWLASVGVSFANSQQMINFFVSNVQGPSAPLRTFGAEIREVLPIVGLFGNETVSFMAFSYCGNLNLVTVADSTAWPDLDVLCQGMEETWREMAGVPPATISQRAPVAVAGLGALGLGPGPRAEARPSEA